MECITDRLNDETSVKFQVKKKNVQEHFKLLLDKFKAKQKHQAKLCGRDNRKMGGGRGQLDLGC